MDTTSLIIITCVLIPALLAIGICAIIVCSNYDRDRKLHRQRGSSFVCHHLHERVPQDNYIIDFPRTNRYQQQWRLREPPPVFEESSPSYDISVNQIGRQQLPVFTSIRTTPLTTNVQQSSPTRTSSGHATMPPSYAEIFLTPYTLTNR
ncbi:unnamed protein product [Rotaria sp. Silwood1]|nr:unnamed protein product [Rotaria sp. Silwood1]CAF0851224.1 unnamed protein product [Rotaria sp. Silwood1]CAF0962205.1 unnamed protein product [Rotaria sp. Silwood1]